MANTFTSQFVGRSVDAVMGVDVDAIAGATVSSQAVVDALNLLVWMKTKDGSLERLFWSLLGRMVRVC